MNGQGYVLEDLRDEEEKEVKRTTRDARKDEDMDALMSMMNANTSVSESSRIKSLRRRPLDASRFPDVTDPTWGLRADGDEFANRLCVMLDERKESKMRRVVERVKRDVVVDVFRRTLAMGEIGGLNVVDGTRKRSAGGVFWRLLEKTISKEDMKYVTLEERRARNRRRNAKKRREQERSFSRGPRGGRAARPSTEPATRRRRRQTQYRPRDGFGRGRGSRRTAGRGRHEDRVRHRRRNRLQRSRRS